MMMTEKYYTLPPSSSSLSPSSFNHSTKTKFNRTRLYAPRKSPSEMKLPPEQQTSDVQNRIDYFEKKKQFDNEKILTHSLSTTEDTLQTVIANTLQQTFFQNESYGSALSRTMINSTTNNKRRTFSSSQISSSNDQKRTTKYSSLLAKRVRTYSLSNHATMAITATTSFSEEQTTEPQETTTMDYENTYFYPEETTRLDDVISLTTITPNLFLKTTKEMDLCSDTTVSQSDSEELTPLVEQYDHTYVQRLPSIDDRDFAGVVHARKCRIIDEKDCLSSYDNVNRYCEPNTIIRSKVDNVSLNPMMIISSSIEENHCRTNSIARQSFMPSKQRRMMIIDHDESNDSDASNYSEDFRYSSDAARSSCTSDDLNNTSSTLRQEAISITRVRCKRRKTWIRSPSSPTTSLVNQSKTTSPAQQRRLKTTLIEPFLSTNSIAGTDVRPTLTVNSTSTSKATLSTVLNQTRVKTTPTNMLLHNNSLNSQKNAESFSYDFMRTTTDHHESSSLNISNTPDKDVSSPKTNKKLTEYVRSSLSPVKRLLNESLDSNIEVIQMDEQECILEIVDGVLTIVPRDKSSSSSIGEVANSPSSKPLDASKRRKQRSSSVASSVSTPSLSEQDHERDGMSLRSSSKPLSSPPLLPIEQPIDVLDLFSTPINPNKTNTKTLLFDDSLSSVSSFGERPIETKKASTSHSILRSSSPINHPSKSSSIKDTSNPTVETQTRSNKNTLLSQLLQTVKKTLPTDESESEKSQSNIALPKPSTQPTPKPINKDRINEFASLLSSSVHLSQPQLTKTPIKTSIEKKRSSSTRSDEPNSSSSYPSVNIDRESHGEQEPIKRHIDARYTEKLDDRGSIKINTANIKALFEQKISDTNRALSQSTEHLSHIPETRSHHKKVPVSYRAVKKDLPPPVSNQSTRRRSYQEPPTMIKLPDPINATKDVVIEDKQSENGIRPSNDSSSNSPVSMSNGYFSESLIAREIRETKEKEEELKRQRKKCGLEDDASTPLSQSINDSIKSESSNPPALPKNSSFLSNLDFFTSKLNATTLEPNPMTSVSRRSTIATHNLLLDLPISSRSSANDEFKQMTNVVSQELHRFNENGVPILRTSSTNGLLHRSASNQNIHVTPPTNNIIQREIAAIRAKEAELRESGRIQHTSDEHADPRKYQETASNLPKSQSINPVPSGKKRRDSENQYLSRQNGSNVPMTNGFSKPNHNNTAIALLRERFPSRNPSVPVVNASNKSTIDSSKLSTTDRLVLEKRQCHEREQELKKQRHSIVGCIPSTNTTINGDSGNVSQEEHDDDQEHYFDKIERLKRTQNEKAQAPLIRPTKKSDMSQKWEQMMANKLDD